MTSWAPGQGDRDATLLPAAAIADATTEQLHATISAMSGELHDRALAGGDLDALVEQAFLDGFTANGVPLMPWIHDGILVCPGYRKARSASSHDCSFVSLDGTWVWAAPNKLVDAMRDVPGAKSHRCSITLVVAQEGMQVDAVTSKSRAGGGCQMVSAQSFQVRGPELVHVTTRTMRAPTAHS
jgi:hypothetical protein